MANYIGVWLMGVVTVPEAILEKLEPMYTCMTSGLAPAGPMKGVVF